MVTLDILIFVKRGNSKGIIIPTPIVGVPDIAPTNMGAIDIMIIIGRPMLIIVLNRLVTVSDIVKKYLKYNVAKTAITVFHLTPNQKYFNAV